MKTLYEAAGRILHSYSQTGGDPQESDDHAVRLSVHYQDSHKPDDNRSLHSDEEWLRLSGFECFSDDDTPDEGEFCYWRLDFLIVSHVDSMNVDLSIETANGLHLVSSSATRGDVRRLAKECRVELKNQ